MEEMNKFSYYIVLAVCLGWMAIGFSRMLIIPLLPVIEDEFNVSHAQAALLMSSYLLPYAAMQLPAGLLSNKFDNKFLMILAMLGTSIGSFFINFTSTFNQILAIRFLTGIFAGLWFTSSSRMVTQYASSRRRGLALGLVYAGSSIASVLVYLLVGVSSSIEVIWRSLFMISSIPGFLCMVFICTLDFKDEGKNSKKDNIKEGLSRVIFLKHLKICSLAFILHFSVSLASWSLSTFIPTYLALNRGLSVAEASAIMTLQAIASIFSYFIVGALIDRFGFKKPLIIYCITMCLFSLFMPILPLGIPLWILLFLWGLTQGWSFIALNIFIISTSPRKLQGAFLGIFNQIGFIGAAVGSPLFGFLIDILGFESFFVLSLALFLSSLVIGLVMPAKGTS